MKVDRAKLGKGLAVQGEPVKALSWRRERVEYYDPLTPFGGGLPGADLPQLA